MTAASAHLGTYVDMVKKNCWTTYTPKIRMEKEKRFKAVQRNFCNFELWDSPYCCRRQVAFMTLSKIYTGSVCCLVTLSFFWSSVITVFSILVAIIFTAAEGPRFIVVDVWHSTIKRLQLLQQITPRTGTTRTRWYSIKIIKKYFKWNLYLWKKCSLCCFKWLVAWSLFPGRLIWRF